jgi:hypothetical protein
MSAKPRPDTCDFTLRNLRQPTVEDRRHVLNGRTADFRDLESVLVRETRTTVPGSVAGGARIPERRGGGISPRRRHRLIPH